MSGPLTKYARQLVEWAKDRGALSQFPASNRQQLYAAMFNKPKLADSALPEVEHMFDHAFVGNPSGSVDKRVAKALRDADIALRFETTGIGSGRGPKHFDLVGGRQVASHIPSVYDLAMQRINDLDLLSPEKFYSTSRVRVSPLSLLGERPTIVPDDYKSSMVKGRPTLYANLFEGADDNLVGVRNDSSLVFDILDDMIGMDTNKLLSPSVRDYYNQSLAVPASHPLYKNAAVLKAQGGSV